MAERYIVGEMHQFEWYPKHLPNLHIQRIDDDGTVWNIPSDEGNGDYQAFLAWCDEGNTPEPYVPPEVSDES